MHACMHSIEVMFHVCPVHVPSNLANPTNLAFDSTYTGAASARDLLGAERARRRVTTFCPELDSLLGGGVAAGAVTEFCKQGAYSI